MACQSSSSSCSVAAESVATANSFERNSSEFCENPACLGTYWHEWLTHCPGSTEASTNLDLSAFDLLEDFNEDDLYRAIFSEQDVTNLEVASTSGTGKPQQRLNFAPIVSDSDVVKARQESIPKRTREDTAWCYRLWEAWSRSRIELGAQIPPITSMETSSLQY